MDTELTEQEKQWAWEEYKRKSKQPERPDIFSLRTPIVSFASPGVHSVERKRKLEIPTDVRLVPSRWDFMAAEKNQLI